MRSLFLATASFALLLTACSQEERTVSERITTVDAEEAPSNQFGFAEAMEGRSVTAPSSAPPASAGAADIAANDAAETARSAVEGISVGAPQVAYRYAYGFRTPANAIKPLQERHADMCEAMGSQSCRIISMRQADSQGDYAYGSLSLAVAAPKARAFGKELAEVSGSVDGELVSSSIDGEDLSKQIVDTEARLRARTVLRDRLLEVLRTRKGTVAELVEAERGVAQVNEEIDQASSWLAEMKTRVSFSQMQIAYESGTPSSGGFIDPVRDAWGSVGAILGGMLAMLILGATFILPIALSIWLLVFVWRRSGWKSPFGKDGLIPDPSDEKLEQ